MLDLSSIDYNHGATRGFWFWTIEYGKFNRFGNCKWKPSRWVGNITSSKWTLLIHIITVTLESVSLHRTIAEGEQSNTFMMRKRTEQLQAPGPKQRMFKSARLVGDYEMPWLEDPTYRRRELVDKVILSVSAFIGLGLAALICWMEWNKLPVYDVSCAYRKITYLYWFLCSTVCSLMTTLQRSTSQLGVRKLESEALGDYVNHA